MLLHVVVVVVLGASAAAAARSEGSVHESVLVPTSSKQQQP